ncbi:MAG: hypothetical protein A2940_02300 [Candidatus Wildermuthbacteria bacterium RIFCSPLOWO2_01_FULL_48_29]|uniref:PIN domain-containing protein n=2 Tax=Candidatus Wildermuthiibacteriota TaxID=1817923 RepID=A0A1G2RKY3_9BACT|nr:MAG: hypothetical protein A2843_02015 [Candidatus Wildermuthbacteria bacterium RIFCSPHIGHO2_01_FULL_48_27b]OHA73514.1 MAG: hypothetical protein A2940_02300 [Candidatus Wildermuthbacteria bacterium RIFCSPLOWO2_01_FULL_48_29]
MVVLDTNIIIDHLRQSSVKDTIFQSLVKNTPKSDLAISIITVQELYEGSSTRKRTEEEQLLTTLSFLRILPYTFDVAQRAGEIARDLGRSIEIPDAAIAATTLLNEASLLTLNQKDFEGIQGLELVRLP